MSFSHLSDSMLSRSFMGETNPVLQAAREGNLDCAKRALAEYSALIMAITTFLDLVAEDARASAWHGIQDELYRNINEENGSESGGVPHRVIIAHHFEVLGLNWPSGEMPALEGFKRGSKVPVLDLESLGNYQAPTRTFIMNMLALLKQESSAFTVGMALALETTASPELQFVARITNELLVNAGLDPISEVVIIGGEGLEEISKFSLEGFFAHHIHEWEAGHQGRLEDEIQHELDRGLDQAQLESGFIAVLDLMDTWWTQLAKL